ncbi:MAG: Gfo/Idh/MocA family oxidoreductase [Burkholderiales bacterium]|nr:Gfo/Idh/MocA family oxidoreductase [Burkholderiales bacterium]
MGATPHAQSLLDLADRVEVAWACTRSAERAASFAARFPFPVTRDVETVLADPTINCVLIATPPATHLELATRCAAAGKHVLLEKPLEVTLAKSETLVERCAAAGVRLGVVFQHRFRPGARRLAALVESGALGALAIANVQVPWWRPQSYYDVPGRGTRARDGGGVLITQAIHQLDLFLSLAGAVSQATAFAGTTALHRMETEDVVAGALRFANGALGAVMATTAAYPGFGERIELVGTRGTAVLADGLLEAQLHDGTVVRAGSQGGGGGGADPMAFSHDAHRAVLADFLDAVDAGTDPLASGRAALAVHRLIEALLASAARGMPVHLPAG